MLRYVLIFILISYLIVGSLYAIFTPAWQAPDEPAHYNYIAQVARGGCCPVIEMGDWDSAYLDRLKSQRFNREVLGNLSSVQYEDHQPPLYYLLAAPIFNLTNGSLVALRLYSVMLGSIIVVCTYLIGRMLLPERPWVAVSAAAFVAFLPQNVSILASVNNDALGWALIALTLLVTVWYLTRRQPLMSAVNLTSQPSLPRRNTIEGTEMQQGEKERIGTLTTETTQEGEYSAMRSLSDNRLMIVMGVLVGAIFITKVTGYLMVGVVLLAIYLKHRASLTADPLSSIRGPGAMVRDTLAQALRTNSFVTITNLFEGLTLALPYWLKRQFRQPLTLIRAWALFLVPAVLIGGVWWVRNFNVYGVPDFLGLRAHDRVVVGQARTAAYVAQYGETKYFTDLVQTTFTSFWGQFGWMALPLNGWLLWVALSLTLIAATGWIVKLFLNRKGAKDTKVIQRELNEDSEKSGDVGTQQAWIVLVVTGLLALAAYAYYNSEFLQFQGRYLYAGLIPMALAFALGLEAWASLIIWLTAHVFNSPLSPTLSPPAEKGSNTRTIVSLQGIYWVVTVVPVLLLAPFCLYLLWRVIVPGLAP